MERPQLPERLQNRSKIQPPPPLLQPTDFPGTPLPKPSPKHAADDSEQVAPIPNPFLKEPTLPAPMKASRTSEAESPIFDPENTDNAEAVNFLKLRKGNRKTIAKKEASRWKKRTLKAGLILAIPAAIIFGLFEFHTIPSNSMAPTVGHKDLLVSFRFSDLTVTTGDIVVFDGEGTDWGDKRFLKRVIGVDGDTVQCCDAKGRITVNEKSLTEPYIMSPEKRASSSGFNVEIEDSSFFALGDNRNASKDSRYFFTQSVPYSKVIAKPFLGISFSDIRIYPL